MPDALSPNAFGVRQLLLAWAPWIALGLIIVGLGVTAAQLTGGSPILHVLGVAGVILATGGIMLAYAATWMHMLYRGLVPTPRTPWRVKLDGGVVHIATAAASTTLPLAEIATVTLLEDDSWDRMNGIETWCLVLRRRHGVRICIPGSSHGFDELVAAVRHARPVERESL